ncbi:hypothetical protein MOQ_003054 [Trypanosoma cruzi marinkellei]|uniref:Bardet-Biedl syndrome 7 protein n=1 Tax=Trypanosoma cruzi marinkellei TaxID=85056 RepID=K2NW30_TRYCR|nr:hypothetical protein MOQ_003054 [Trypanosoma cruzi marinkellei]
MITAPEIELVRREVTTVASRSPRCMVVYPLGKKSRQRIGVADKNGIMSVFSLRKAMERVAVFETPPQNRPVSCATIYEDQLFFVHGSTLEAYSRKGRRFFSFDTNVTDVIHTLFVSTPFIICCGNFMATGFREASELGFYMAPDSINAMAVFAVSSVANLEERSFDDYRCILGCNDRTIRMLRSHKSIDDIRCEAPVTSLCVSDGTRRVYYGTSAGSLGCLDIRSGDSFLSRLFSCVPDDHQASVTALAVYDINMDEREELLVGRQDGSVQVFYVYAEEGADSGHPVCMWSGNTDESVLSMAAGFITDPRRPGVLVHSFSGRITTFTLKEEEHAAPKEIEAVDTVLECTDAQINEAREEIEGLKQAIEARTRELAAYSGVTKGDTPLLAVSSTFKTKVKLSQQKDSPALRLIVEVDTPLDCVVLQSELQLHFLERESAEVIVQEEIPRNNPLTKTIAIVRPLETRNYSCSVAFWLEDGQWGLLKVTALAAPAPRTAQVKMVQLRPLPLYARVGKVDKAVTEGNAPPVLSTMEVRGNFSARDMHSWIFRLLPGTPEMYQEKMSTLSYEDTFFHNPLEVKYGDGSALFTTELLQVLMVTERFIRYCASERSLEVSFSVGIHSEAVRYNLSRIVPRIAACNKGLTSFRLLEALQELQGGQQTDIVCFPKEYQRILSQADEAKKEHAQAMVTRGYLQKAFVSLCSSVVDIVPKKPKMSLVTKEALAALADCSDASEMMSRLDRLLLCDEEGEGLKITVGEGEGG